MLRIAVDIDNTIYDTDRCTKDVYDEANRALSDMDMDAAYSHSLYARINEKLDANETWFNPKYLIPEAIAALQELGTAAELYICTARWVNLKYYDTLFKDTALHFADIIQRDKYYGDKACACMRTGIDVLIDDDTDNLLSHYALRRNSIEVYKTHFVLYTGHTTGDTELSADYYREEHKDTVSVMSDWCNFGQIVEQLRKERNE